MGRSISKIPRTLPELVKATPMNRVAKKWFKKAAIPQIDERTFASICKTVLNRERVLPPTKKAGYSGEFVDTYTATFCLILYWDSNLVNQQPFDAQVQYLRSQPIFWRNRLILQYLCAVYYILCPVSKTLIQPMLEMGIRGCSSAIICGFKNTPKFWGDPSDWIDPQNCASWSWDSRLAVSAMAMQSCNSQFRAVIYEKLGSDHDALLSG